MTRKKPALEIIPIGLQYQLEAEAIQKQLAIGNAVLRFLALDDSLWANLRKLSWVWIPSAHRDSYPTEDLAWFLNQSKHSAQLTEEVRSIQNAIIAIIQNTSQFAENRNLRFIFDIDFVWGNTEILLGIPLEAISEFNDEVLIQYISFLISLEYRTKGTIDSSTWERLKEKITNKLRSIVEQVLLNDNYLLICLFQLYSRNDLLFLDSYLNQQRVGEKKELFIGLANDTERFTDEFRSYIQSKVLAI